MLGNYHLSKILIGIMLVVCGIKDIKSKEVSIRIVALFTIGLIIMLPFNHEVSIINSVLGGGSGFLIILLSKATRGQIGMGDGIILCATGVGLGVWDNLTLLLCALFWAALYAVILLTFRWADRKKRIPFVPFLLIGFIGVML